MSSSTFAVRGPGGEPIRFAYWVPNVSGGLVISNIEQRTSWDIDYNRKLAQTAEHNGFDYALSQIRFTAGYGAEYQHEPVLFSHALLAATKRLKLIVAILPGPWNPAVAGFKTNLIGTPEQIAERIVYLKTIGVDLVLTAFLHFQEEVEYFGKRVLPIVRELEQQRALVAA